ncbi:WYL domain-containing protein [Corynebacterium diphtheriae]|nr:WYL domain-containing protein [Corynebacterium diphtheriae]
MISLQMSCHCSNKLQGLIKIESAYRNNANHRLADLVRLLNLLPYFQAHPGRSMMEAAVDLGSTPSQIKEDLNRLFCCGPGTFPDELVDLDAQLQSVTIFDSQGMDAPLRLTRTEAGALLLSLEYLEQFPELVHMETVKSAAKKLREIMGSESSAVFDSQRFEDTPASEPVIDIIRDSMAQRVQLQFDYYSRAKDTTTKRIVSATRLFSADGSTYLVGWDHEAQSHRTFLTTQIRNVWLSTQPAQPHVSSLRFDASDPFGLQTAEQHVEIEINESAQWLTTVFPLEDVQPAHNGWIQAIMPVVSYSWLIDTLTRNADRMRLRDVRSPLAISMRESAKLGLTAYASEHAEGNQFEGKESLE